MNVGRRRKAVNATSSSERPSWANLRMNMAAGRTWTNPWWRPRANCRKPNERFWIQNRSGCLELEDLRVETWNWYDLQHYEQKLSLLSFGVLDGKHSVLHSMIKRKYYSMTQDFLIWTLWSSASVFFQQENWWCQMSSTWQRILCGGFQASAFGCIQKQRVFFLESLRHQVLIT